MKKIIAAINMTLDGFCDHTAGIPDEEIHQHYTDLLSKAGIILYGRKTYELMEYWRTVLANPTGNRAMNNFAVAIDNIPKMVFSRTLKNTSWKTATVANGTLEQEVLKLKQQAGKHILVGSRSLIIQLMNFNLIDELQICIHPVIAGGTLPLFENINARKLLKLKKTKTFGGGAVILYYEPAKSENPIP